MVHFEFTGKISFAAIVAGAFFAWFLQEVPAICGGRDSSMITAIRWVALMLFSSGIFVAGWLSNRKKAMRDGPDGKMILGSPNTIFHVPLQYWAFIYLFGLSCAIMIWQTQKP
jgi:hypothetical protein